MRRIRVHLNGQTLGAPGTSDTLRELLAGLPAASVVQSAAKVVHHLEQPGSYLALRCPGRFSTRHLTVGVRFPDRWPS